MKKPVQIDTQRLVDLAEKAGETRALLSNLFELYQLCRQNENVGSIFSETRLNSDEKLSMLKSLSCFEKSELFWQVVQIILLHDIADKIYLIFNRVARAVDARNGLVVVQVFSAFKLEKAIASEVVAKLEKLLSKQVLLKSMVKPNLIGGILIKLPSGKMYDFTIQRKLTDLKYFMMEKA